MPENSKQWLFPGVIAGVYLIVSLLGGFMPLFMLELVLPVFVAMSVQKSGVVPTLMLGVVAALSCFLCGLGALLPIAAGWSAIVCAAGLIPLKANPKIRPYLWGGAVVLAWGVWIMLLQTAFSGNMITGMADMMREIIANYSQRDQLLMSAYNMGIARLSDPSSIMTQTLYGQMIINLTESARTELLNSFRTTMEEMLPLALCEGFLYHLAVNVFLCTLLPDRVRRKQGERGIFPPLEEWHMPRQVGLGIGLFAIGFLLSAANRQGMWLNLGTLLSGIFSICYTLQGCCMLLWIEKKMGMRGLMRYVWAIIVALFIPILAIIMGIMDQTRDVRHLRVKEEM